MSVITEGLVKWETHSITGMSFKADGLTTHAGIPYIRMIKESNVMSISGINEPEEKVKNYQINANTGNVLSKNGISSTAYRKHIPVIPGGYGIGPWGTKGYLFVKNFNEYLGAGKVISYIFGSSVKHADKNLPATHKLLGLIVNSAQNKAMAITVETTDDPLDGYTYATAFYWVIDIYGNVLSTGPVDGGVSINTFGFGRSAQRDYICSVLEPNNTYAWAVDGSGLGAVSLYSYATGTLSLVQSVDDDFGITDSSYFPANPSCIVKSGTLFVVAGDVVYKYKRQSVEGMGYDDSKSWIGEIIQTESFYSGLINDYSVNQGGYNYGDKQLVLDYALSEKSLHGFMTTGGPIRDNLEQLRGIGFFDIIAKGYSLYFKSRGDQALTDIYTYDGVSYNLISKIPYEHIGASEGTNGSQAALEHDFETESQLPRKVELKFQDVFRNYDTNFVESVSEDSKSQTVESITTAIVMAYKTALNIAQVTRRIRWVERHTFKFTLPAIYCTLEPGDVVPLEIPFDSGYLLLPVRLVSVNYKTNGLIAVSAKATAGAIYSQEKYEAPPDVDETDPSTSQSSFAVLLDVPPLTTILETYKGHMVAGTGISDPWGGCSILRSDDDGQTFINMVDITTPCTIGTNINTIGASNGVLIDKGNSLSIKPIYGEFLSITDSDFLFDKNIAIFGNEENGWEILKFRDAVLELDGTYTISHMIRGLYGTEWRTGNHDVDEIFILLTDVKTAFSSAVNVQKEYKLVDIGDDPENSLPESFTYTGANLKPFSPCRADAYMDILGNTVIRWVRRSRFDNAWVDLIDIPLNETYEKYEIDILDAPGGVVVRTLLPYPTPDSNYARYTPAQQTTDFGGPQTTIYCRIYQMSSVVGRGFPLEVTLNV